MSKNATNVTFFLGFWRRGPVSRNKKMIGAQELWDMVEMRGFKLLTSRPQDRRRAEPPTGPPF